MLKKFLSRQYLESVSTADLIALADDYGIEIPDNLNRRFIIGELLEAAEEINSQQKAEDIQVTEQEEVPATLPKSYNHTKISAILRNPAWAFVFWDIKESDCQKLSESGADLFIHINIFDNQEAEHPCDSFMIQVGLEDREHYVLIPAGKRFFTVNLEFCADGETQEILAYTKRMEVPAESEIVSCSQPGKKLDVNPLVQLSGMETLLHQQYLNHRQSFN